MIAFLPALPAPALGADLTVELDRRIAAGESPVACLRDALRAFADTLRSRFLTGDDIAALVRGRADFVDAILWRAWHMMLPPEIDAALVAVGGYGRGELHPASDIDLMIVLGHGHSPEWEGRIEQLVVLLWDIGLEVGHSVRTLQECRDEAARDITIATNVMESRLVAGRPTLHAAMREITGPDRIWPSGRFFEGKLEEQRQRHRKYDDTAYNLEPNIKENPGGLRDIQMVGWVAKRHFGVETMADLVARGFLTESEHDELMAGQTLLWRIRFALHLLTGRREDRLLFDHQRALAGQFGYADHDNSLAVEQFMQSYYRTVMKLNRLNELLLQLFQEAILLKDRLGEPMPINSRFQARSGFIEVVGDAVFRRHPLALLEMFLLLQQHPELTGVRAATIRVIRSYRSLIDDAFRASLGARSLFMEILRQPRGITHELRRMHRYGILGRYLPEFGAITGRMQYDLFHVFTVDEHTLTVVRNLRRFFIPALADEFPLCSEIALGIPKPELLYIAGLFHDIAKGRGGDHSVLGAEDALAFCLRHELSEYDSRLVAWLVRRHLVMSMTAQRKDIADPEVIQRFAEDVGDPVRLDYLYLLTVADVRATNPARWNSWKDSLLRQLYSETRRALVQGLNNPRAQDDLIAEKQAEAERLLQTQGIARVDALPLWTTLGADYFLHSAPDEIAWHAKAVLSGDPVASPVVEVRHQTARGATAVFVCAPDSDNLFALTTALLSQLGLNVVDARIQTTDSGLGLDTFIVLEEDGSAITDAQREEEIVASLRAGLSQPDSVDLSVRRRVPRHIRHFETPARIEFGEDARNHRTVLHLTATDRPGLLSLVGQALAAEGVRLINAKIATLGAQVEDTFFVTDRHHRPLDHARLSALERTLLSRLDGATPGT